jgi:hypothetical protein
MPPVVSSITLNAEQIATLQQSLSALRHNVNNQLALLTAGMEVIQRKPDLAAKLAEPLAQPTEKILAEVREFSDQLEKFLQSGSS